MTRETTKEKDDQSFPKSQRLLKNPEFVRIQRIGRRFHTKNFIVIVAPDQKNSASRLGITITKKLEKTAVKRNRVKRRVRAAYRQFKSLSIAGISILVIAKTGSSELKTQEVYKQLLATLKFNGFIKEIKNVG